MNVIWANRIVLKPREIPKAMNISIREIPVTISEFSIGILLSPMQIVRGSFFIAESPMAAAVPRIVAISADRNAISNVL